METIQGRKILDICQKDPLHLTNEGRQMLITHIVQFYMERNECMRPYDFEKIKNDIISYFPGESGVS